MKASEPPIIVAQTLDATPLEVWNALTRPQQMRKWYFDNIPDFKPTEGFTTQFPVHNDGKTFTHVWVVTEVILTKKISYRWHFTEYPGKSLVSFDLTETSDGTTVTLTNTILEDFQDDIPEFRRESCRGGWKYFIQQQLKKYLE